MNVGEGLRRLSVVCLWTAHLFLVLGFIGGCVSAGGSETEKWASFFFVFAYCGVIYVPAYLFAYILGGFGQRTSTSQQ